MVTPILIDLFLAAILALFVYRGTHRGFVLTLCSLAAVIVALIGANLLANALAPKVADFLQPRLEQSIRESLEEKAQEVSAIDSLGEEDVLAALKDKGGVYEWAADGLEDLLRSVPTDSLAQQAAAAAAGVAEELARSLLFLLSFVLLLIAWGILSHALNLVAKLPVLKSLNRTLGGALGLLKGFVVIYVAAWALCSFTQAIPEPMAAETHLLRALLNFSLLDVLLGA